MTPPENPTRATPPVPTTTSRIAKRVVHGPGRCLKGEPLVVVIVAADDQLRPGVVEGLPQRGGQPVRDELRLDVNRGWCQMASVHEAGWAARSARSHVAWAELAPHPPTCEQLLFSTIPCHDPMSKL